MNAHLTGRELTEAVITPRPLAAVRVLEQAHGRQRHRGLAATPPAGSGLARMLRRSASRATRNLA